MRASAAKRIRGSKHPEANEPEDHQPDPERGGERSDDRRPTFEQPLDRGSENRLGAVLGYVVAYMMEDMLDKAGSTETEKMLGALRGGSFNTIVGPVLMRASDQQSTMGAWVGETTKHGKVGSMKSWTYQDGTKYMFSEAEVAAARKD